MAVVERRWGREAGTYWLRGRGHGMHSLRRQCGQQRVVRAAERCEVRRVAPGKLLK